MNDDNIDIEIGYDIREYVINNLVEPYYKEAIKGTINGKKIWRIVGISLETISKILVAAGSIVSFSAGYYHDDTLSFVSGSISCMSLAMLQLSSFSYKENKKQSQELNTLLKKLNLDTVPVLDRQTQQSCMRSTVNPHQQYQPTPMPMPMLYRRSPSSTSTTYYDEGSLSSKNSIPIWSKSPDQYQYMTQNLNNKNIEKNVRFANTFTPISLPLDNNRSNSSSPNIIYYNNDDYNDDYEIREHHNSISSSNASSIPETPSSNLQAFTISPFISSESSESSENVTQEHDEQYL